MSRPPPMAMGLQDALTELDTLPGCRKLGDPAEADFNVQPLPIQVVTSGSQLPPDFLEPSPERLFAIGFDCEGVDLCRTGELCIMQLAWEDRVILVDVVVGGVPLMEACRKGLESPYITKVVHDCKRDSEALYFQYNIKLQGVFDTQVAYTVINKQMVDTISFVHLLQDARFCGVAYEEKQEVRDLMRQDTKFWVHRPWSAMMERVAADDVRFLLRIYSNMKHSLTREQERQLAVLSAFHCQCFCIGAEEWPIPPSNGVGEEEEVVMAVVEVPPGFMGRIIGRKGASIRAVKEDCSRADVVTGGSKGPFNKVFVIGPVKEVRKAEAILRGKMLGESWDGTRVGMGRDGEGF